MILMRIFLVLALTVVPAMSQAENKSIVLTSAEYAPYYGAALFNRGPVTEIVTTAFETEGYEVKVDFYPWVRAENLARNGKKYDGMFPPWHSEDREQWFVFSKPMFANQIGFYKLKNSPVDFTNYASLKQSNHSIGIVNGYVNPKGFDEAKLNTKNVSSDLLNLRKLVNKRIDLALIDKKLAQYIVFTELSEHLGAIEWIDPPLEKKSQYLVLSKKAVDYQQKMADFNRGLDKISDDGTLAKIMKKHGF